LKDSDGYLRDDRVACSPCVLNCAGACATGWYWVPDNK